MESQVSTEPAAEAPVAVPQRICNRLQALARRLDADFVLEDGAGKHPCGADTADRLRPTRPVRYPNAARRMVTRAIMAATSLLKGIHSLGNGRRRKQPAIERLWPVRKVKLEFNLRAGIFHRSSRIRNSNGVPDLERVLLCGGLLPRFGQPRQHSLLAQHLAKRARGRAVEHRARR